MNATSLEIIERNVILNTCLRERLGRLARKHCVNRNERQYGNTVAVAKEWFMSQLERDLDIRQQQTFVSRTEIARWVQVFLEWKDWEAFIDGVMEHVSTSGVIKAFVLQQAMRIREVFGNTPGFDCGRRVYENCFPARKWNGRRYVETGDPAVNKDFYYLLSSASGKSAAQVLMEADLLGYDWTWDMVQLLALRPHLHSLLEKLIRYKLDAIAEAAAPEEIAKFTIGIQPCDYDWDEADMSLRLIAAVTEKWPTAYLELYRKQFKHQLLESHSPASCTAWRQRK